MIKAVTISIGDELLSGKTVDTNNAYISQQFGLTGVHISKKLIIGDTREDIISALDWGFSQADVITLTGGLGPTHDDITKTVLCEYFKVSLKRYPEILAAMHQRFEKRGFRLAKINEGQADYPSNAELLVNPVGTAQGMHFVHDSKHLFVMPGVPSEMRAIVQHEILPRLREMTGTQRATLEIHSNGFPESSLYELTKPVLDEYEGLKVAYLPKHFTVTIRVSTEVKENFDHLILFDEIYQRIKSLLPDHVYGRDGQSLSEVVGQLLKARHAEISTAESCTGGLIASMITDISGSSDYFKTGFVTYSNETKMRLLGVQESTLLKHGAVSEETVAEMLTGARRVSGAAYSVAVSGVAGPTGGSPEKPVGTVYIGVASDQVTRIRRFQFGTHRISNKELTANAALNMLRLLLEETEPHD